MVHIEKNRENCPINEQEKSRSEDWLGHIKNIPRGVSDNSVQHYLNTKQDVFLKLAK